MVSVVVPLVIVVTFSDGIVIGELYPPVADPVVKILVSKIVVPFMMIVPVVIVVLYEYVVGENTPPVALPVVINPLKFVEYVSTMVDPFATIVVVYGVKTLPVADDPLPLPLIKIVDAATMVCPETMVVMYATLTMPPVVEAPPVAPLDTSVVADAVADVATAADDAGEATPPVAEEPFAAAAVMPGNPRMIVVAM